ncbi:MAG: general secretion pathway protein GspG [Shackletoniella antarctica]|jgi:prepilin-type N-terminal cleavage/methylation domain-containing protein|uniref:General secretion pathway protein GspG n=1 Tax=Shackletoniella antarctica TaxID=268115 RepID=A0A2W4Y402_9CYAN|nr:MAG: general secretion pathway protein GspG [Shackletoniella antarctica]
MADTLCHKRARPFTTPDQRGFTLIELLVVIVIVGILAAIAVPSFLSQVARAKQARALNYIGLVNRAQQAFYMENTHFAISIEELGVTDGMAPDYIYEIIPSPTGLNVTSTQASPVDPALRGYAGVVFTTVDPGGAARTSMVICQGAADTTPAPTPVKGEAGEVQITNCNNL